MAGAPRVVGWRSREKPRADQTGEPRLLQIARRGGVTERRLQTGAGEVTRGGERRERQQKKQQETASRRGTEARGGEGRQPRLARDGSEKEFREERCGSLSVGHMNERMFAATAEEASQGMVITIAARVEYRPGVLVLLDPVEAIVAPDAHPESVVLFPSAMAMVPLLAEVTLSPKGIPVGHVEEGAARRGHLCRATPA